MEESQKSFNNHTIDPETCFSITPKQGTLDRNDVKVFEVVFSPSQVKLNFSTISLLFVSFSFELKKVASYNTVAQFLMHGIPEINKQMIINNREEIHKSSLTKEDMTTTDFVGIKSNTKFLKTSQQKN